MNKGIFSCRCYVFTLFPVLLFLGCRSTPPPPPVPEARREAQFQAESAAKVTQAQNWTAAARAWQSAADRFSMLNDQTNQAIALHNWAQAELKLGQTELAHQQATRAEEFNQRLGRTQEWWRNQILLLQVEDEAGMTEALEARFQRLRRMVSSLNVPELRGLFFNELGQWQQEKQQYAEASASYNQAEQEFIKIGMRYGVAAVAANRAQMFAAQKQYASALQQWERAMAEYERLAEPEGIARSLAGKGRVLLLMNQDLPLAEEYLTRAAHNYHTLHKPAARVAVLQSLLLCMEAQQKPVKPVQEQLAQAHDEWAASLEQEHHLDRAREQWQASAALWTALQRPDLQQRALAGVKRCSPGK